MGSKTRTGTDCLKEDIQMANKQMEMLSSINQQENAN